MKRGTHSPNYIILAHGGAAGALILAPNGCFAIRHTTPTMCAGWWDGTGQPVVRDRFQ